MNYLESTVLTAVIPISTHRDDFHRLNSWISYSNLKGITLILVFDSYFPDERYNRLVNASSAEEIIIISGEYGGPGFARNQGISRANSKWITFWDSDDLPHVENIMRAIHQLDVSQGDIGICEFEIAESSPDGQLRTVMNVHHNTNSLFQIVRTPGIWRFIFKTSQLQGTEFINSRMGEDQAFLAKVLSTNSDIRWITETVYTYVRHSDTQLTRNQDAINELIDSTRTIYDDLGDPKLLNATLRTCMVIKQCVTIIRKSDSVHRPKALRLLIGVLVCHPKLSLSAVPIYLFHSLKKTSQQTYIALNGGLGNQLFELAAALYLTENKNVTVESKIGVPRTNSLGLAAIQDLTWPNTIKFAHSKRWKFLTKASNYLLRSGLKSSKSLGARCAQLVTTILAGLYLKSPTLLVINQGVGWSDVPKFQKGRRLLIGYFQSYRFQDDRTLQILREAFSKVDGREISELRQLAQVEKPLIVHVRLADYKNEPDFGIPSKDYYHNAISAIYNPQIHKSIWLFSDEINEAMSRIPEDLLEFTRAIDTVDGSDYSTLSAMTLGQDYVIANSTFSWWAARLSVTENPRVVYPSPWFSRMQEPIDLFPPDWLAYHADFEST